jgi:hypothetical protein
MITRREMFKNLGLVLGSVVLSEEFIDKAIAITDSAPLGPFIKALRIENAGRGAHTYVGLPGMNVDKMEGVFLWLRRGEAVSVDLSKVPEIRLSDFAIQGGDAVVSWITTDGKWEAVG